MKKHRDRVIQSIVISEPKAAPAETKNSAAKHEL